MPDVVQPEDLPADLVDAVHAAAMAQGVPIHQEAVRVVSAAVLTLRQELLPQLADPDPTAADELDEDDHETITYQMGDMRVIRCDQCDSDRMLAATIHGLAVGGTRVTGGVAACHECGWSPYSTMKLPWA